MTQALIEHFDLLAASLGGVAKLRELILSLAVRGKLVPQDPADEPASELLKKIRAEKDGLIAEGRIKRDKALAPITEDEKPYELPEGWEWMRLGTSINLVSGQHLGPAEYFDTPQSGSIPYLTGPAEFGNHSPEPTRFTHERRAVAVSGDILVTVKGSGVGKTNVLGCDEMAISRQLMAIRPVVTDRGFLELVMATLAKKFQSQSVGIAIPGISREDVLETVLSLPPLAEQSRIVAKVEELMALCDRLAAEQDRAARVQGHWIEAALGQLAESADADEFQRHWQHLAEHFDTLFTTPESISRLDATLLQLAVRGKLVPQDPKDEPASELLKKIRAEKDKLIAEGKIKRLPAGRQAEISDDENPYDLPEGWEWGQLQSLALSGPTNGFSPKPSAEETAFRCLSLSATTQGYFKPESFKFVDIDESTAQKFYLKPGDLLIQRGNSLEYVGISAIYNAQANQYIYPDLMMRLQLTQTVSSRFVHLYLNSSFGRTYFMGKATGTQGTMPKVNQGTVASTPIPLPPLAEQSRIVAKVEELMALTASLKARLAAAQTKQAHLAEALIADALAC